mmetsp:Transcript_27571/g.92614  ORF Transcript_27571/g.92614 Transcript_27571/m.92614 type:complete len:376 (-) Transcript_27571:400-1527(-)
MQFAAMTSPILPAFFATWIIGAGSDLSTISAPRRSSSSGIFAKISADMPERYSIVDPPPGRVPISMADFTALTASTYRSFLSFSSVSVAAPTLIRAMPPPSAATRSAAFSVSKLLSDFEASRRICTMRFLMFSDCLPSVTIVVSSLPTTMRSHVPSMSTVTVSKAMPTSCATYVAPVATAMSLSKSLRRVPNPGAFSATTSRTPRILFTTKADKASPVMSSAMITKGSLDLTMPSKIGIKSLTFSMRASVTKILGLTISQSWRSWSLTKYGERKPRSIVKPSVNSTSSYMVCDSSTVVEPVSPTCAKAFAMMRPISSLPDVAMVATMKSSSLDATGLDSFLISSMRIAVALFMPRRSATGFTPAETSFMPWLTNS